MSKKSLFLWAFILMKFAIQLFLIHPEYDLQRDEYLHLDLGKHLAWGYTSVPPVTSWIAYLILLLGNSVFWIKFFPALFGVLTMVSVWKITEELKGGLFALILGATAVTFSVMFRLNILFQPNSLDVLCWTLLYYTLIKYSNTSNRKWLWALSAVFAIGFLNKYSIAFLAAGLFPAILLTEHRKLFIQKNFYLAIVLALVLILPNLIWQYQHNFPVIKHMEELRITQLVNVNRLDFIKDQLMYFIGGLFIIAFALFAFVSYKPFKKYRFIPLSILFTLLLFVYFRAKSYYAIGLYPVLLAFGAVYLDYLLSSGWKVYLKPVAIVIPLLLFVPVLKIAFPIYPPAEIAAQRDLYQKFGMLRWEDGKDHELPQDFADMLGWKELAHKVDLAYSQVKDKKHTLVICDNYGLAGAINYYSKHKDMAAVSFNADYKYWFNLKDDITTVISVKCAANEDIENRGDSLLFEKIVLTGKIENPFARESGTCIFLMTGPKTSINAIIKERLVSQ
ncbi:glycosyltransferase family 39 protein [Pedobacter immunditicola]|uniref:glycosyltransferase family 39 protein n=1 Tax=Pedobacter immunditicola TaxID=3133440 RepID=UPI0030B65E44